MAYRAVARLAADAQVDAFTVGDGRAIGPRRLRHRADAQQSRADATSSLFTRDPLARLRHDVDQIRLAAFHDVDAAANRGG